MNEVQGYYKDKKVNVKFDDTTLSVGTKKIKYDDIYYIQSDNITNYGQIVTNAFTVGMACVGILIGLLVSNTLSIGFMGIFALIGFMLAYFLTRKVALKNNENDYLKIIDIYYKDSHESIVVPYNFTYDISLINKEKKNTLERSVLSKYRSAISRSRKYLVGEFEKNPDLTDKQLYTKYSTVATERNRLKSVLSVKQIGILKDAFYHSTGKYVNLGHKVARFAIVAILMISLYAFFMRDSLQYSNFF